MNPRRPLLAGNSLAAIYVLELMTEVWSPNHILVVAPPRGRAHEWQPSLADHARTLGVAAVEPHDVNDDATLEAIRHRETDLMLSVYYTQLFSADLLQAVAGTSLNFHPSLLPRHRGTAPLIWSIAEGDHTTGVTVHELTTGIDTGPIVWQRPLPIHANDTGYTLHLKAAALVRAIASDLFRRIMTGRTLPEPREQVGEVSVHTSHDPRVNQIDWATGSERIRNIVRALAAPLPGAHTFWSGEKIGIDAVSAARASGVTARPGVVKVDPSAEVYVATADGAVRLDRVRWKDGVHDASELVHVGLTTGEVLG